MTDSLLDDLALDDALFTDDHSQLNTSTAPTQSERELELFQNLPVQVTLSVATAEMTIGDLTRMGKGDVIVLERMIGEPLDILVNGLLVGRGEVVDVNGRYGVRLLEVEKSGFTAI